MAEACSVESQADHSAVIAALRERGAERFDPVRFRFIEALARRAEAYQDDARQLLDGRLAEALQEYTARFEQAQGKTEESTGEQESQSPLAELAAYIAQRSAVEAVVRSAPDGECPAESPAESAGDSPIYAPAETSLELKSVRYFRDTWSRLSVEQQLTQALAQGPENAGPLNSHLLVLRSFKLMRDISPDYLNRFMAYADALLWLDQAGNAGSAPEKPFAAGEGDRKRKSRARPSPKID